MRLVYMNAYDGDIVLCEAPPGTAMFWPGPARSNPPTWKGWKVGKTIRDMLEPRTRVLAVADEVRANDKAMKAAIRRVFKKLPESRQKRGVMGIILKGKSYDADGHKYRLIGFFHVLRLKQWDEMLSQPALEAFAPPTGFPASVSFG